MRGGEADGVRLFAALTVLTWAAPGEAQIFSTPEVLNSDAVTDGATAGGPHVATTAWSPSGPATTATSPS